MVKSNTQPGHPFRCSPATVLPQGLLPSSLLLSQSCYATWIDDSGIDGSIFLDRRSNDFLSLVL